MHGLANVKGQNYLTVNLQVRSQTASVEASVLLTCVLEVSSLNPGHHITPTTLTEFFWFFLKPSKEMML